MSRARSASVDPKKGPTAPVRAATSPVGRQVNQVEVTQRVGGASR